ncbi:hypothetical protein JL107_17560 [Nakamurella flavida]|uniref:Uncharacterized protein n=1 Tax=Nakamurella flavida TaxID=363630 RepID=A0A939C211_9ACTN|nr:hypothetical protein [Nakamurella flavida]MBM9478258.1 hypothetical protein [Nakamurella flavida]MDP9777571.1 hypothetical protein [Nakamurella flavida]
MTRDIPDATAEARLRAALTDRYPLEPVDDAQLRRVMTELASGAAPTEPFAVLPLAAPARRRGWTTALLAAAVAVVVALVGVSATLLLADGTSSSPAIAPTVPVTSGDAPATPSAPTTGGATTSPAPSATVPLSTPTPDRPPVAPVETPPAAPDSPEPSPPSAATGVPPTPAPTSVPPAAEPIPADPQAFRVDDTQVEVPGMIHFVSPSGNISCVMADKGVPGADCVIEEADFPHVTCEEPTPALTLSFSVHNAGQTSDLRTTPPDSKGDLLDYCDWSSAGSDGSPSSDGTPPLPYGSSLTPGATTCVSETTGVTCRSLTSGAGFQVSRSSYRLF